MRLGLEAWAGAGGLGWGWRPGNEDGAGGLRMRLGLEASE